MASLPHLLTNTITTTALSPPPPPVLEAAAAASSNGSMAASPSSSWDSRISTSMLLIIAILAIIFFLSGLLHLLIRYLLTPSPSSSHSPHHLSSPPSVDDATALQGQLQQLFHLHDSGVDQSFIDALPIFLYRSIVTNAAKSSDPFDCAVCLCEFEPDDRLRLLPKCSHAFHLHCIDTWLLSHSTCPLCRRSLLPNPEDPLLLLLDNPLTLLDSSSSSASPSRSHTSLDCVSLANSHVDKDPTPETKEMVSSKDPPPPPSQTSEEKKRKKNEMVAVKLGKFRNNAGGEGSSTDAAITDRRRCFSMGSFEYVLDEGGTLPKAAILPPARKPEGGGGGGGHRRRLAMSECDCDSRRMTVGGKKESVSFSKTWLRGGGWGRKERARPASVEGAGGSRRSFRLGSEFDSGSELGTTAGGFDVESFCEVGGGDHGVGNASAVVRRGEEAPSFARRTMLWVMGRGNPNKVGSHV